MNRMDEQAAKIQEAWERDHEKYPGMAKDTFVTNWMFSGNDLESLTSWLLTQPDLHGRVFESGAVRHTHFVETGELSESGRPWVTADLGKPYVHIRVAVEVVTDGKGHLTSGYWPAPTTPSWCD